MRPLQTCPHGPCSWQWGIGGDPLDPPLKNPGEMGDPTEGMACVNGEQRRLAVSWLDPKCRQNGREQMSSPAYIVWGRGVEAEDPRPE